MVSVTWGDGGLQDATWDEEDSDLSGFDSSDTTSTSDSSTSTSSYDVPSGYVEAATRDGATESEQLSEVEDSMEGGLDTHSVTTTTNADGSTSVTAESNLGEEVTSTTDNTPMAGNGTNEPATDDGLSQKQKKIVLGLAAAGAVAVGVSYSG